MKKYQTSIIVKPDELNHHYTLFVGKALTYMCETGFITASMEHTRPDEIVCFGVNMSKFFKPVPNGRILTYTGQIVRTTKTSLTVYVKAECEIEKTFHLEGFVTYITIDIETRQKKAHGIVLDETTDEEELKIRKRAADFFDNYIETK